jgi:hypothetical protein
MRTPTAMYSISLPTLTAGSKGFKFSSSVSGKGYSFNFSWNGTNWQGWATMPDSSVRPFGVFPNAPNWTGYPDVGLLFALDADAIGPNDLSKVSMYLLEW